MVVMTSFDPSIGKATQWKRGQPSPNPGGRPKSRLLSDAIRVRLGEVKPDDPDHRTYAEIVAANLIEVACSRGAGAVGAANEICDRAEGKASQRIEVSDITQQLRAKSDDELRFYLANGRWATDEELLSTESQQTQ